MAKLNVHFEPVTYTGRVYEDGKSFEARDCYVGVFTATVIGKRFHISGYHGAYTRSVHRQIVAFFAALGIHQYDYETSTGHRYTCDETI